MKKKQSAIHRQASGFWAIAHGRMQKPLFFLKTYQRKQDDTEHSTRLWANKCFKNITFSVMLQFSAALMTLVEATTIEF